MSRRQKILFGLLALLALLAALAWWQRIVILQYSLGLYTDFYYPRAPNRPVEWLAGPADATQPADQRPPNVIVILADDLGFNDVTTYGGGRAELGVATPNIDALAREGVRFDQGYAGSAVCTVSRAGLLTGRYPWRFGVEYTPLPGSMGRVLAQLANENSHNPPVLIDQALAAQARDFNEQGMPPSELTLAKLLHPRGYHNVHIGKWHLGGTPEMRPNNQGFDESLYMESGLYLPQGDPRGVSEQILADPVDRFLWPNMRFGVSYNGGGWFEPDRYLTDYFTEEAVRVIGKNKNRPFFLYLAHWGVHTPLQAAREDYEALAGIKDHRLRVYGAMIRSIDRSVGRVMQALRENGLEQNTIVIFTSDNGAPGYISIPDVNRPYRGFKLTFFEGGLRVPFVAKWPGHIPAGSRYDAAVSNIDIVPTIAAAAGAALPTDRIIDGVNVLPYLADASLQQPARPLFWRDGPYRAVLDGGWKLITAPMQKKTWLFDLKQDPTEKRNVAANNPQQVARLRALLEKHHAGMPAPQWESFLAFPIYIDRTLEQPRTPDDEFTYWYN